jgi:hypothetical protein
LPFRAAAPAVAEFDWVRSPELPGLRTRIDCASLDGESCTALASASASCLFLASWPAIWVWSEPGAPPICDWVVSWLVLLAFAARAPAVVVFDCETAPSLPGLRTRIELAPFVGPAW